MNPPATTHQPPAAPNPVPVVYLRQKTRFLVGIVSVLGSLIIGALLATHTIVFMFLMLILPPLLFRALWAKANAKTEREMLLAGLVLTALALVTIITLLSPSEWRYVVFFFSIIPALIAVAGSYRALECRWSLSGGLSPFSTKERYPSDDFWLSHLCFGNFLSWVVYHGTISPFDATVSLAFYWFILPALFNWLLLHGALTVLKYFPAKEAVVPVPVAPSQTLPEAGKHEVFLRGQIYCIATVGILLNALGPLVTHSWMQDEGLFMLLPNLLAATVWVVGSFWALYHLWFRPSPKTDRLVLGLVLLVPCLLVSLVITALTPDNFTDTATWIGSFVMVPLHACLYRYFELKWLKENIMPPMPDGLPWPSSKAWFAFVFTWISLSWLGSICGLTGMEDEDIFHSDFWGIILPCLLSILLCRSFYRKFLGPEVAIFHLESWKN